MTDKTPWTILTHPTGRDIVQCFRHVAVVGTDVDAKLIVDSVNQVQQYREALEAITDCMSQITPKLPNVLRLMYTGAIHTEKGKDIRKDVNEILPCIQALRDIETTLTALKEES